MSEIDRKFIEETESAFFRTDEDIGANLNAMLIWNLVRQHVDLPRIGLGDLPSYCETHKVYHKIEPEKGCRPKPKPKSTQ